MENQDEINNNIPKKDNFKSPIIKNPNISRKKRKYVYKDKTLKRRRQDSSDAKYLAFTLRLVKTLIKEHYHLSRNRSKVIDNLQHLIDCFDKQVQRNDTQTPSIDPDRQSISITQGSSPLNHQEDSIDWVAFELEDYLLIKELNKEFLNNFEDISQENYAQTSKDMG